MSTDDGRAVAAEWRMRLEALEEQKAELLAALKDAALIINGMRGKVLPECFRPSLEMVNAMNFAIYRAQR